jgi:hypothetical protein
VRAIGKGPCLGTSNYHLELWHLARSYIEFCLLLLQSLADRAQAQVVLLREVANAHAEVSTTGEATMQDQIEAA